MISETKKDIVIKNYFKDECDMNTTLKEAYTKGFNRGLEKAPKPKIGKWEEHTIRSSFISRRWYCSACNDWQTYGKTAYCPNCGAKMINDRER